MTRHFTYPFATDGTRTPIDDSDNSDISYQYGYPAIFSQDPANGGSRVQRGSFNQLMFAITDNLKHYQEEIYPNYVTASENNNQAISYPKGSIVRNNTNTYIATADTTDVPNNPPNADDDWLLAFPLPEKMGGTGSEQGDTFLRRTNNLSDLTNVVSARSNLGLGTVAVRDEGLGLDQVPLVGNPVLNGNRISVLQAIVLKTDSGSVFNNPYTERQKLYIYTDGTRIIEGVRTFTSENFRGDNTFVIDLVDNAFEESDTLSVQMGYTTFISSFTNQNVRLHPAFVGTMQNQLRIYYEISSGISVRTISWKITKI